MKNYYGHNTRSKSDVSILSDPKTEIGNRMIAIDIIHDITGLWDKKSLLDLYGDEVDFLLENGNDIIERERQAAEVASDDAVFGSGVTHIVNNATNGTIRFESESPEFGSAEWFDGIKEIPL